MSSVANVSNEQHTEKTKKPRKPVLPMKYQRYMVFTRWFVKEHLLLGEESEENIRSNENLMSQLEKHLKMFDSVQEQKEFFKDFDDNVFKPEKKEVNKLISQHNKPPKEAKKAKSTTKKPRSTKSKKNVVVETNETYIQLVNEANHVDEPEPVVEQQTQPEPAVEVESEADAVPEPEPEPKKGKKTNNKKKTAEKPAEKPNEKSKKLKTPELKRTTNKPETTDDELVEEIEVETEAVIIDGVEYYVDDKNNVYDENSEYVGKYCRRYNTIKK